MNIFSLDENPQKSAEYHVNKHVVKMITEQNQLLCTAHHVVGSRLDIPYRKTHENHPSAIWVRKSRENYINLCIMNLFLCAEYTYRYDNIHAGEEVAKWCLNNIPSLPNTPYFPPSPAMDDMYKIKVNGRVNSLLSYRNYYKQAKTHLYEWKRRDIPQWVLE